MVIIKMKYKNKNRQKYRAFPAICCSKIVINFKCSVMKCCSFFFHFPEIRIIHSRIITTSPHKYSPIFFFVFFFHCFSHNEQQSTWLNKFCFSLPTLQNPTSGFPYFFHCWKGKSIYRNSMYLKRFCIF